MTAFINFIFSLLSFLGYFKHFIWIFNTLSWKLPSETSGVAHIESIKP